MKVHLYGNTLNNSYNLARFLRAKGIEAVLFLDNLSSYGQDYPWWEDPSISPDRLPDWIHYYPFRPHLSLKDSRSQILVREFSQCDVGLVNGWGSLIANAAGIPYFFWSHGADLLMTSARANLRGALHKLIRFQKPTGLREYLLYSQMVKKAILNADRVGVLMGFQIRHFIEPLGLMNKLVLLRHCVDMERYSVPQKDDSLAENYQQYQAVYFMPTRHSWTSVWRDWKGNDKFLRAYGRFVHKHSPNVKLICVNKGYDVNASKKLIKQLGIGAYVEWVDEMNKDGIRAWLSLPNVVVVDQFFHDQWYKVWWRDKDYPRIGLGAVGLEALCAGRPLISVFFDHQFYEGNEPPMLSAFTESEIYKRLVESYNMTSDAKKRLALEARRFMQKYHAWENTIGLYIQQLESIASCRRQGTPS